MLDVYFSPVLFVHQVALIFYPLPNALAFACFSRLNSTQLWTVDAAPRRASAGSRARASVCSSFRFAGGPSFVDLYLTFRPPGSHAFVVNACERGVVLPSSYTTAFSSEIR